MKKIFLVAFATLAAGLGVNASNSGKVIFSTSGYTQEQGLAIDANNETHYCFYDNDGWAFNFKIYDTDFNLEKEFTINLPDPGDSRDISVNKSYVNDKYTFWSESSYIVLTQNTFNSDNKWEVVFEEGTKDFYDPNNHDEWNTIFEKYLVYTEDGNKILEFKQSDFIPFAIDTDEYYSATFYYIFGNKQSYLQFGGENDDAYFVSFYDNSSSVRSISKLAVKAYPNPLPAGRKFTIVLDSPMANVSNLLVSDTNGHVVYRKKIKAGSESIEIPAGHLRNGMYIYSIVSGTELIQSGKIIAE